eukprot:4599189-Pyramimonas_sp.AAC.1
MDDRSLTSTSAEELARDLTYTRRFDTAVGFKENERKRQMWDRTDRPPKRIEHLGIVATPADATKPISLRGGWDKLLHTAIRALGAVPGGAEIRARLAVAYIRPLALLRAITRSTNKWWCYGRWWAQH